MSEILLFRSTDKFKARSSHLSYRGKHTQTQWAAMNNSVINTQTHTAYFHFKIGKNSVCFERMHQYKKTLVF